MSYLEMPAAPLPNMSKGIISLWFREVGKDAPSNEWPQGYWTEGTNDTTMVPPNIQYLVGKLGDGPGQINETCIFWWNSFGMPIAASILGDLLLSPAACWIPSPPPIATDNVRMLLTFGDSKQNYEYYNWQIENAPVIDAVKYKDFSAVPGAGWDPDVYPPPYAPYSGGPHDSVEPKIGLIKNKLIKQNEVLKKPNIVPQSFIGIDNDGYITINLQTNTKATYQGYSFQQTSISEIWANLTHFIVDGEFGSYTYTQVGWPFPDGHWEMVSGYWNGYQFEYEDISNQIMAAAGESFLIGGTPEAPRAEGDTWHHLLFSFDISGSVSSVHQPTDNIFLVTPSVATTCKAWLALDDINYSGSKLQYKLKVHDGVSLPKLEGTRTTSIFDASEGPVASFDRFALNLGPNEIVPRNVFLSGWGMPRQGLLQFTSTAPTLLSKEEAEEIGVPPSPALDYGAQPGDFNPLVWTGNIWTLYGAGVAPGPWLATLDPPRPTAPDPKSFSPPTYSCSGFSIPVNGHPIGIPVGARHLDHNTGLEMAELQIWFNKTLDTSDINMRRLFIDKNGVAVSPSEAQKVLGKPDILLHGTSNWKEGINTGTSGLDSKDRASKAGQFKRVAKIERFEPDPALGK